MRLIWVVLGIFAAPFLCIGVSSIWRGLGRLAEGNTGGAAVHLVGGLVCCGLGGLVFLLARHIWRFTKGQIEIAHRHPDEPWRWREEWSSPRLRSGGPAGLVILWIFSAFWIGGVLLGSFHLAQEALETGNQGFLIMLVLPAAGIGLAVFVIRQTRLWRKFGESTFELEHLPAVLGGELAGTLHTKGVEVAKDGFHVRISCVRQLNGAGDRSHIQEEVLWSDTEQIPLGAATRGYGAVMIPIHFALPSDAPPSHALQSHDQIVWRLETSAELPGPDYESSFEIPVFRTYETDPERTMKVLAEERPSAQAQAKPQVEPEPSRELTPKDVELRTEAPTGLELDFPPIGYVGTAIFFALLAAGAGLLAWVISTVPDSTIVACVVGGFAAVMAHSSLHLIGASTRLRVRSDGVDIQRRLFGIGPTRHVPAAQIAGVEVSLEVMYGKTQYYQIRLLPRVSGPTWTGMRGIKAGARIPARDEAERIARRIRTILGL